MLRHFVGQSHPSAGGEASKEHVDDDAKEDHVDEAELLLALLQRCGPALTRRQASDFVRRSKVRPLPGPSWLPVALRWFGGRWRPKYSREAAVAAAAALAEVRRDSPRALPRVHSAYCSTHAPSLSDPVSPEGLLRSCVLLQERAEDREHGIVVVGNGRSILGGGAGAAVDAFRHVLRFNDYEVDGFARDVGSRTSLWVVSDWTRAAASSARSSALVSSFEPASLQPPCASSPPHTGAWSCCASTRTVGRRRRTAARGCLSSSPSRTSSSESSTIRGIVLTEAAHGCALHTAHTRAPSLAL